MSKEVEEVKGDTKIVFNLPDWKTSGAISDSSRKIRSGAFLCGEENTLNFGHYYF